MKISINGQDYTEAFDNIHPLTIVRRLNEPSTCDLFISIARGSTLPVPGRNASLTVIGDDGTSYFTGYIAITPLPEYAGESISGSVYRMAIQAVSDEILLDQVLLPPGANVSRQQIGSLLSSLISHSGMTALQMSPSLPTIDATNYSPELGSQWSRCAGSIANQTRTSYRALNGTLSVTSVGNTVHLLDEREGHLALSALRFSNPLRRGVANDITVCGEHEPVAYVTELFLGDGTTSQFFLSVDPFFLPASRSILIDDAFDEPAIDTRVWAVQGGVGCLTLGGNGLAMNGGSGRNGDTTLSWIDPIEVGGTQLLELVGVTLNPGSSGILAGEYNGALLRDNCVAGFVVSSTGGSGAIALQAMIDGELSGAAYTVRAANQYTLRIRSYCPEMVRNESIYRTAGGGGEISVGGGSHTASGRYLLTVQEFVNGVGGMPVVLYDGAVAQMPEGVTIAPVNSDSLIGSVRAVHMRSLGSGWVAGTPPGGSSRTRATGSSGEASECHIDQAGRLVFYPGFIPEIGEVITANYRTRGRAVGRSVNSASQKELSDSGLPSVLSWTGSVTNPPARTSADCRNAAYALAEAAASTSALWAGTYKSNQLSFAEDVWPGDALRLTAPSLSLDAKVTVRSVHLTYASSYPDIVEYAINFANDWGADLAISTSSSVPSDTWLPTPLVLAVLENPSQLVITGVNGSELQCSVAVTLKPGWGIEVRRRDFCFRGGQDTDLVARFTTVNFSLARKSVGDRFYIRLFDGSTPPNYSECSAALFVNLPLGS